MRAGVLRRYYDFLPLTPHTPIFSLGEGDTPLVQSRRLVKEIGCDELYLKLEGCNPTGSFKDRGMVLAVAKAIEEGSTSIICASTGNTSASAAAYGASCGLKTFVVIPKGRIAAGKLVQAMAYGASIFAINGSFDEALHIVRTLTDRYPISLVNSVNRYRLEGQKTAAYEVVDALGDAPDALCIPVGNAGNITAYWNGFVEYKRSGQSQTLPKMIGFQAAGAAPIVHGKPIEEPQTVASAIRIGKPASWKGALQAKEESGGLIKTVTDEEILESYRLLARTEGVFCEPASAASVAGLRKLARSGVSFKGQRVVCVITGSGLKDPDTVQQHAAVPIQEIPADLTEVERAFLSLGGDTSSSP